MKYGRYIQRPDGRRKETVLYKAWCNMRARCAGTNHDGRGKRIWLGLTICPSWDTFEGFRAWSIANGFCSALRSLDRLRSSEGYGPTNCEWVTKSENTRRAITAYWEKTRAQKTGQSLQVAL